MGTKFVSFNRPKKHQLTLNLNPRVFFCLLKSRWSAFQKVIKLYSITFSIKAKIMYIQCLSVCLPIEYLPRIIGITEKEKHWPQYGKWKKKKYLKQIPLCNSNNIFCDHTVQSEQITPNARNLRSKHKTKKELNLKFALKLFQLKLKVCPALSGLNISSTCSLLSQPCNVYKLTCARWTSPMLNSDAWLFTGHQALKS